MPTRVAHTVDETGWTDYISPSDPGSSQIKQTCKAHTYVRFTYKEKSIGSVKYTETHDRDKFKITCSHTEPNMSANTLS